MKKTFTTCVLVSLTALLSSACGGKGFLGESNESLEGEGPDGGAATATNTDDSNPGDGTSTADDAADDADPVADDADPAADDADPAADDADPVADDADPVVDDADPAADDADPAADDADPAADDADPSDPTDDTGSDPVDPDPTDPTDPAYDACAGKSCGDECNSCPPDAFCITGPGYCSADGACSPAEPVCEPTDPSCPESCPVPKICQQCEGSDTCAEPVFECNDDGSCGEIVEWVCPDPDPEPTVCPDECPVIEICKLCDDGSCAEAKVACNDDGSCGETTFECAEIACKVDADCGEYTGDAPCLDCAEGAGDAAEKPALVPPEEPLPPTYQCPRFQCVENACKVKPASCEYDPCDGKQEGDNCTLCAPNDPACSEIDVLKTCQSGSCEAAVSVNQ